MKRKVIISLECELQGDDEEVLDAVMLLIATNKNYAPHRELAGAGVLGGALKGVSGYGMKTGRVLEVKLP